MESTVYNAGENWELQLIQNKALRIVYEVKLEANPTYNTNQLHVKSKCFYLEARRDIHLLSYAYSLAQNPRYIDQRQLPAHRNTGRRLIVPRSFKPMVIRSALYRAISRWNQLKPEYTTINNINSFKISIKKNYQTSFM